MTDHSSGENNIESLAQRAKEVLDRVRSNTDSANQTSATPVDPLEFDAETSPPEVDTSTPELDTATPELDTAFQDLDMDQPPEVGDADSEAPSGYIAAIQTPSNDVATEDGPEQDVATDPNLDDELVFADVSEPIADDAVSELAVPVSTALVPIDSFDNLRSDDAEEDNGRKLGCLIPLLLLGLIVLALIVFWGQLFGSDDDPVLLPGDSVEVTTTNEVLGSSSSSADTDTTVTTATTSTTTTTPTTVTPAPLPIPATAWELLDGSAGADQFAAFGAPFGLQALLEGTNSDAPDGFTLLAPSNDAISALSQDQIAGFGQDPASAEALIGYHIIDQLLTPEVLLSAAGGQIESRIGLPIDVSLDGDDVVLNGQARVALDSLVAGNGNVLVIDSVLQPPTINSVIELGEVQFKVISAIITPGGEAELQKAVAFFEDNPDANALIEGHTDTDGPAGPNQGLSERRAEAVRSFLISQGIDGARLTAEGFGETQPVIVDGTEDKAASRRIELNIR